MADIAAVTDEQIDYVMQYGGRCRDCADNHGICTSGLPCEPEVARRAIRHVLNAIVYGTKHGYLATPQDSAALREAAMVSAIAAVTYNFKNDDDSASHMELLARAAVNAYRAALSPEGTL